MNAKNKTAIPSTWQQLIGVDPSHLSEFKDNCGNITKLHPAIILDLQSLFQQAKNDGIPISIISGFRNFDHQLLIWNNKWQGHRPVLASDGHTPLNNITDLAETDRFKAIALWSALPGYSRHHWGTDLDIFSAQAIENGHRVSLTPQEFSKDGPCEQLEKWLDNNLEKYGFFRPYHTFLGGVSIEPWHISHKNTADAILKNFNYDECKNHLKNSQIQSPEFIAKQIDNYIKQYFLNINKPKITSALF